MLRDGYINSIIRFTGVDYQQYRPAIGFINGEYWGIYNMREKISEHFISSHHDVPTDNISLLAYNGGFEDNIELIHGSKNDFLEMQSDNPYILSMSLDAQRKLVIWYIIIFENRFLF